MAFARDEIENLIFSESFGPRRFTQDSPVYPDVWLTYFLLEPDEPQDVILTPHWDYRAADLLKALRDQLRRISGTVPQTPPWELANSGASVAAKLTFDELMRAALPLTSWMQKTLGVVSTPETTSTLKAAPVNPDLLWLRQMVGAVLWSQQHNAGERDEAELSKLLVKDKSGHLVTDELSGLFDSKYGDLKSELHSQQPPLNLPPCLWSVSRNRTARHSLSRSIPLTKADATRRVFDVDGSGICWAVIDSGIDARHPAFRKIDPQSGLPLEPAMGSRKDRQSNHTRIVATYDFTNFRQLMANLEGVILSDGDEEKLPIARLLRDLGTTSDNSDKPLSRKDIADLMRDLTRALKNGRMLDWSVIGPLLRIPHNDADYKPPRHPHGTHVAGILGANMRPSRPGGEELVGMCPCIDIYDLRVMDETGEGEEFNILAALQFVRWLNVQKEQIAIHGANLSLSMPHAVVNFACGRTPVCDECERLVSEGVVVVAAAGNQGRTLYETVRRGIYDEGFRTISITDPGNAEGVITVGATHKSSPHTYGVSYFSSRGPTGDGRIKPDLLAPGEKILSCVPGDGTAIMDGTSMAAPHVSGAAALLLDRHRELIGRPKRVKEILCQSAVDIGRERYFQGYGLIDTLRALQSV